MWDFDDNTTLIVGKGLKNVYKQTHAYAVSGTYTVRVTARNNGGESEISHVIFVGEYCIM